MRVIGPESKFVEAHGSFELSRPAIERIVRVMERHVPAVEQTLLGKDRPRKVTFSLEFKDGRKAQTSDLDDLDHFGFDSKDRESFEIKVDGVGPSVGCTFSYAPYQSKAQIHAFRTTNVEAAAKEISEAVVSARTWYSVLFEHSIGGWSFVPLLVALGLTIGDDYIFGRDVVPVWVAYVTIALVWIAQALKAFAFDRLVIPFGAEAQRIELKQRMRRGVPLALGAIGLALIGGGYLLRG
jgi:hypothetical protein